jgi:hypothetical protein
MKYALLALTLAIACIAPASPARRTILIVNAGNEAIFSVHLGYATAKSWGADLLTFGEVIDVSTGRDVPVDAGAEPCLVDVQARYGDGDTQVRSANVCTSTRIDFNH